MTRFLAALRRADNLADWPPGGRRKPGRNKRESLIPGGVRVSPGNFICQ